MGASQSQLTPDSPMSYTWPQRFWPGCTCNLSDPPCSVPKLPDSSLGPLVSNQRLPTQVLQQRQHEKHQDSLRHATQVAFHLRDFAMILLLYIWFERSSFICLRLIWPPSLLFTLSAMTVLQSTPSRGDSGSQLFPSHRMVCGSNMTKHPDVDRKGTAAC